MAPERFGKREKHGRKSPTPSPKRQGEARREKIKPSIEETTTAGPGAGLASNSHTTVTTEDTASRFAGSIKKGINFTSKNTEGK